MLILLAKIQKNLVFRSICTTFELLDNSKVGCISEILRSNFVRLQKARNKFGISLDLHYL